jgi:hypothetical protein
MLVATVIAAVLMAGVLSATVSLSRDRQRLAARDIGTHAGGAMELVRRDLANATAFIGPPRDTGFALIGHGGIDARTFVADGRLCYVAYRLDKGGVLVREQAYLDDPIRVDRWREVVAVGVRGVGVAPVSADGESMQLSEEVEGRLRGRGAAALSATRVPSRVRVRIEFGDGAVDREMVLR